MFEKIEYRRIKDLPFTISNEGDIKNDYNNEVRVFLNTRKRKVARLNYDSITVTMDLATLVYEAFTGKKLGDKLLFHKDSDFSNCSLENLTVIDSGFKDIELKIVENFTGLACILNKAGLEMSDFNFLNLYKDKKPSSMSVSELSNWERIMFLLVDSRRDFIRYQLVSRELEKLIDELVEGKDKTKKVKSVKKKSIKK